jgi:hypothetical protein
MWRKQYHAGVRQALSHKRGPKATPDAGGRRAQRRIAGSDRRTGQRSSGINGSELLVGWFKDSDPLTHWLWHER